MFSSEFVALIGSPNVGKSTLLNAFVGEKIAIVSKKPQTTRNRITGILTGEDYQIVFLDTPGIHMPKNKLDEYMVKTAQSAARDVDVVLFVADVKTGVRERDREILEGLPKNIPVIIAINKIDAVDSDRIEEVKKSLEDTGFPIYLISASQGIGVAELEDALKEHLQEGPMFYPPDIATDQPKKVLAAEMIREKALKSIGKEIPHGIGVEVDSFTFDEEKQLYRIEAVIYTERESHKKIIIGAGGLMLKKIGSAARIELEEMLGEKVFLQLWVKVKQNWRNKNGMLRRLGYE